MSIDDLLGAARRSDESGDKYTQTVCLVLAGRTFGKNGDQESALKCFREALAVGQTDNEQLNGITWNEIGLIYNKRGEHAKALECVQHYYELSKTLNDTSGMISALHNIAMVYNDLGDMQNAKRIYEMLLPLERKAGDPRLAAASINNLAYVYFRLGQYQRSANLYQTAYLMGVQAKLDDIQAPTSIGLGDAYLKLNKPLQAQAYYQRGLKLSQKIGNRVYQGDAVFGLGDVFFSLRQYDKAIIYFMQALNLQHELQAREEEVKTLSSLMSVWSKMQRPGLAVLYGKMAVNLNQATRENIKDLSHETQQLYLRSKAPTYRNLAQVLIDEGRIAEAEQVLSMLKEEETFSFLRRDDNVAKGLLQKVSLTDQEREALSGLDKRADSVTAIGKEFGELDAERKTSPVGQFAKQARYDELKNELSAANTAFQKYLDELKVTFGQKDERVVQVDSSLQNTLKRLKAARTVVLSTIVGDDRLNLIVTTANTQRAHTIDKPAREINQLVVDLRKALTDPCVCIDPRPAGQKLYDILVKPLEGDLKGIDADTILWSLDGTLRYIPVAALWDKDKGYLAERFSNTVLTLASRDTLALPVSDKQTWSALGVGVSKQTEGFVALTAVPDELDCIVTDAENKTVSTKPKCQSGVIKGRKLLDENFTETAFENALGRYPIIHIASHFSLNPGNDKDSFLLLGGGEQKRFTVEDLRNVSLADVELIVLSACNTATPGGEKANGVEIEGFGAVAQKQGAKAVMATLWSVADESTRDLMVNFYQLYDKSGITKAEALRQAQLAMLKGTAVTTGDTKIRAEIAGSGAASAGQPTFKKDPAKPFAHPYYWAPFVLIGNWR